jgi:protein gp37
MGCNGCELYPTLAKVRAVLTGILTTNNAPPGKLTEAIHSLTERGQQEVYLEIETIALELASIAEPDPNPRQSALIAEIEKRVSDLYSCYASQIHRYANRNGNHKGYAYPFEAPKLFAGRVEKIARMPSPTDEENLSKPWLRGFRRLIFVSDMGDALSHQVSFDFLLDEIIKPVSSLQGRRHIWQWVTKQPARMAAFSKWLANQGIEWPDNLVAMTSISGPSNLSRINQLEEVAAKYRGLSVEPLWDAVQLPLKNIHWVIVGGQSGSVIKPFRLEWAEQIRTDCERERVPCFLKQLGRNPTYKGAAVDLQDSHGGDWSEWPPVLKVRQLPAAWQLPAA